MNLVDLAYFCASPKLRDFCGFNPGFAMAKVCPLPVAQTQRTNQWIHDW